MYYIPVAVSKKKNDWSFLSVGAYLELSRKPLKLVSAIFYFSTKKTSKTMKNAFYFISKALFVLEMFMILYFFPLLSILSRFKTTNKSGIIYDTMNCLT